MKTLFFLIVTGLFNTVAASYAPNILDELNPKDSKINEILQYYDNEYFEATGESPFIGDGEIKKGSCRKSECPVWAIVSKEAQTMNLYVEGTLRYTWPVSTGRDGFTTPDLDQNPNGRVYDSYTSHVYPGGDYNGLGNMPYAVFVRGGYAIHGTPTANWPDLGIIIN